jgi:hypothetical protein
VSAIRGGLDMALARLRKRSAWLGPLLALALAIAAALVERRVTSAGAVDRALEVTLGLVVPLAAFGAVGVVTARERLRDAAWPLARFGASARGVAFGLGLGAVLASAVLGALLAVVVVLVAHGPSSPPLVADAAVCAWLSALTGAAYASWFLLGAAFGRRGRLRWLPLALDFAVGGSGGLLGASLPRGLVHALLGGAAPLALPRPACTAILVAEAVGLLALAAARARD